MGTQFVAEISPMKTIFTLLEGKVDYKFENSGETISLEDGEKIETNTQGVVERTKADPSEVEKLWGGFATAAGQITLAEFDATASSNNNGYLSSIRKYWIPIVIGVGLIFLLMIILVIVSKSRKHRLRQNQQLPRNDVIHKIDNEVLPPISSVVAAKFCPTCGNPLMPTARFCGKCGNKIN